MKQIYANYGRTFIPFRLKPEAILGAECSILGAPPTGVVPSRIEENTRYLATLALEGSVAVSLFSTFDYHSQQSAFNFFSGTYKLHDQSSNRVQFVVHQCLCNRDASSDLKSELPALGFVFGAPRTDPECSSVEALGNPEIYSDHKVGGLPYFSQLEGDVDIAFGLLQVGFVHLLQLSMPSAVADTLIDGMWPFGESVFHVFARKDRCAFDFRYIWG